MMHLPLGAAGDQGDHFAYLRAAVPSMIRDLLD